MWVSCYINCHEILQFFFFCYLTVIIHAQKSKAESFADNFPFVFIGGSWQHDFL